MKYQTIFLVLLITISFSLCYILDDPRYFPRSADYVIVGGGDAGATLATYLSEDCDNDVTIVVLDRGFEANGDPVINIQPERQPTTWQNNLIVDPSYTLENDMGQNGIYYPVVKILGGGGAMNGMAWTRGYRGDYDNWGVPGWDYDSLLSAFTKLENISTPGTQYGSCSINATQHGNSGPIKVTKPPAFTDPAWAEAVANAQTVLNLPVNCDHNDGYNFGISENWRNFGHPDPYPNDVWERQDAWSLMLKPASENSCRLHVIPRATVTKVTFNGDGSKVKRVNFVFRGVSYDIRVKTEAIISAGAFNTPKILSQSGVGNASYLASVGITPVHDIPYVGKNLQNQPYLFTGFIPLCEDPPVRNDLVLIWDYTNQSTVAGNIEAQVLVRGGGSFFGMNMFDLTESIDPNSDTASVRVVNNDPLSDPIAEFNTYPECSDEQTEPLLQLMRQTFAWVNSFTSCSWLRVVPSTADLADSDPDSAFREWICDNVGSGWHFAGTAKMGDTDPGSGTYDPRAVVDSELKVKGVENLRVVDLAAAPSIPRSHTSYLARTIGARAAELIKPQCE